MEACGIGITRNDECHKDLHTRKQEMKKFEDIPPDQLNLILWRADLRETKKCLFTFTRAFERIDDKCCNLFGKHVKRKVKGKPIFKLT